MLKKERDMTQAYNKIIHTNRRLKRQRLRVDLGRSVEVTTATQLVLLNPITESQILH